jgi:hypothetical protein
MNKHLKLYDNIKYKDKYSVSGRVKIYKNDEIVVDKDNKIVLTGRNYIMQRLFNLPYDTTNTTNSWIPRWFSVGNGGATLDAPFQPIWPTDDDEELFNLLVFNNIGGSLYTLDKTKKLVDTLVYTAYLTAKFSMTVDYEDVVDMYINEVGLYAAPSEDSIETNFVMLSHATFPSILKSSMDKIIIEWFFVF